jgi:hypothetical protein
MGTSIKPVQPGRVVGFGVDLGVNFLRLFVEMDFGVDFARPQMDFFVEDFDQRGVELIGASPRS